MLVKVCVLLVVLLLVVVCVLLVLVLVHVFVKGVGCWWTSSSMSWWGGGRGGRGPCLALNLPLYPQAYLVHLPASPPGLPSTLTSPPTPLTLLP